MKNASRKLFGSKNNNIKSHAEVLNKVILNWFQNLQRLLWLLSLRNGMRGISRNKFGMTLFNNNGFTLIELLVVVLIIGILAAVAVPQYQKAVDYTKIQMVIANIQAIRRAENLYKIENGDYTLNFEELDIGFPITSINDKKNFIKLSDGSNYSLGGGSERYVIGEIANVGIYAAFHREHWLCYPRGEERSKRICKMLGCATDELDNLYCSFKI